jgi:nucleoside-diphosphate-sugar epimerase
MYGKVDGIMTEETPVNPCSKKGEVRAQIAEMLLSEVRSGNLKALIARAADFYGPNVRNSIPEGLIIQNYKKGKSAQVFCSDKFVHSYTFTPDAGKATAILGNTEKAYGQVWHLPTMKDPMTGKEFINAFAREFKVKPKYMVLKKWMVRIFGLFTPVIGEVYEMLYQYDRDYIFDSTKFEREFNFQPTSYAKGIQLSVEAATWISSNQRNEV